MSDHQRRLDDLSQQLRDERRLRDAAERKASTQARNARTWRERAEERADRIDRLVEAREARETVVGRLRANLSDLRPSAGAAPVPTGDESAGRALPPAAGSQRPTRQPGLANVQVAHLVADDDLQRLVAECTQHDLRDGTAGFFEADVVVVDAQALAAAVPEVREAFDDWVRLDARQPLVWAGDPLDAPGPTTHVTPGVGPLRHTFDPAVDTPIDRPGTVDGDTLGEEPPPGSPAYVRAAARATAFAGADPSVRAADLRRRIAWQHNSPLAVAAEVFSAAGLSFEPVVPEVAGILVSNRPDDLRRQITAFPHQQHPRLRLQVGCHGFSSSEVADALRSIEGSLPVEVLDLPGDRPLGWCLNRVIEGVGSPLLAKIDDDDHYGPGYLTDAVQALDYAGASIVGRVCSFTSLEGQGRTVLRRLGDEERFYDGTLIGATMVFRRAAWERAPFAHKTLAEDVSLQRGVMALGERMYVASRWDFVYRRRQQGNTWRAPDDHFLANATDAWSGWEPHRADLEPSAALTAINA